MSDTVTGCRLLQVMDEVQGEAIPLAVLYPALGATQTCAFGPYALDVAMDAPAVGAERRLVVISHGNGASPWVHRGLAQHLCGQGYVVALVSHIGNCRGRNELADTVENLANRPRHLRLAIDAVTNDPELGGIVRGPVGLIGMSIGGYSALAAAGGEPWSMREATPGGAPVAIPVVKDTRVGALVLLAPATPWFLRDGALAKVDAPILMRTGDSDMITPAWHAEIVQKGVARPDQLDHKVVSGAGHFSFMSIFPPAMVSPDFPPSQDPPGFDRAAYEVRLNAEVAEFLRRTLNAA